MKYVFLSAFFLSCLTALAEPATQYSCAGKDAVANTAVTFDVTFANSAPGVGYTDQSVTITNQWGMPVENTKFQMYGATAKNNCQPDGRGALYLARGFDMKPTKAGSLAPMEMRVKASCGKNKTFDIAGYCFYQ